MRFSQLLKQYWPSGLVALVILYATLSADPTPDVSLMIFPHADKLIHAIMFGGLAGAIAFDYYRSGHRLDGEAIGAIAVGCALFGLLDECAQTLLTNVRGADALDWLADLLGIIVATVAAPPVIYKVVKQH